MRVVIECDLPDEITDPEHSSALTEEGYEAVVEALMHLGAEDIDTRKA